MLNQSKGKDARSWEKWRNSGAVGTIHTALMNRQGMIKAINNARGVEVIRDGDSVRFIGHFSTGDRSEMTLTLFEADNLLNTGLFKIPGVYGKALIEREMVRIWFKPSPKGADLVCLNPWNFVRRLKEAL
jgi:hypothetical protein